ncbi:MAG: PLD nuclease N-terminal domain-containing protein [Flavisolibacter sp.]
MRFKKYPEGDYVIGAGALLAGVHWNWAVIDVINRSDMKAYQKGFWLIVVIAVPVLGAMVFYTMHQEKTRLYHRCGR